MANTISIRLIEKKDSEDLFAWRNDKNTRQMSKSSKRISLSEHVKWFSKCISDKNVVIFMCENNEGLKLGIVKFDIENDKALVSINLSPNHRGKGLGRKCLSKSIKFLKSCQQEVNFIEAGIKTSNYSSLRSFETVGFECIKKQKNFLIYQYTF